MWGCKRGRLPGGGAGGVGVEAGLRGPLWKGMVVEVGKKVVSESPKGVGREMEEQEGVMLTSDPCS